MSKHTPGPWYAKRTAGHDRHGQSAVHGDDGRDVAIVYDGDSNANLIAAAPELLEALKELCVTSGEANALQHAGLQVPAKVWAAIHQADCAARAAIAKAEGKSHE